MCRVPSVQTTAAYGATALYHMLRNAAPGWSCEVPALIHILVTSFAPCSTVETEVPSHTDNTKQTGATLGQWTRSVTAPTRFRFESGSGFDGANPRVRRLDETEWRVRLTWGGGVRMRGATPTDASLFPNVGIFIYCSCRRDFLVPIYLPSLSTHHLSHELSGHL